MAFRRTKPPRTGAKPHAIWRPHMKTLPRTHPARLRRARPPRSHDKLSLHPSNNAPARGAPDGVCKSSPNAGGGGERIRTDDLLLAKQALSHLSYTPLARKQMPESEQQNFCASDFCCSVIWMVGQGGFEPPTSRLSSARSNQPSY